MNCSTNEAFCFFVNFSSVHAFFPKSVVSFFKLSLGFLFNEIASKVIPVRVDRKEDLLLDTSTRIFLSHKGADKDRVRRFKTTLKLLGFQPWLDEEDMPAGTEIHRGIQQGMKNSCAAVFFITPNFIDDQHLRNEINYAIAQKTEKRERFAIITLVISGKGSKPSVPELLTNYVYKHPRTDLEALNEIIRALPITLGVPTWKPV